MNTYAVDYSERSDYGVVQRRVYLDASSQAEARENAIQKYGYHYYIIKEIK